MGVILTGVSACDFSSTVNVYLGGDRSAQGATIWADDLCIGTMRKGRATWTEDEIPGSVDGTLGFAGCSEAQSAYKLGIKVPRKTRILRAVHPSGRTLETFLRDSSAPELYGRIDFQRGIFGVD